MSVSSQPLAGEQRSIARFNRVCWLIAPFLMAMVLGIDLHFYPNEIRGQEYHDFGQFYMGALIARTGSWDALYPIPNPRSQLNPGTPDASTPRPRYAELARDAGVPLQYEDRFIQPPPFALALEPLTLLSYHHAKKVWYAFLILCAVGMAILAGRGYEIAAGHSSRIAGGVVLLVAASGVITGSVRLMNISTVVGLLVGISVFGLLRGPAVDGGVALVLGAATKYVSAVFLPLYVVMRKWKAIAVMSVTSAVILGLSWAVMGSGPFTVYFKEIAPTLSRANPREANCALEAVCMRIADPGPGDPSPLQVTARTVLQGVRWTALAAVLALIATRKARQWTDPRTILAAAALLLCWILVFSPIYWEVYVAYLIPFWGWLIWEGRQTRANAVMAAFAVLYPCLPDEVVTAPVPFLHLHGQPVTFAGPYGTLTLLATLFICAIALGRLLIGSSLAFGTICPFNARVLYERR